MVSKNKRHPKQPISAYAYPQQYAQPIPAYAQPISAYAQPEARPFVGVQALHDKNASVVNLQLDKYGLYAFKASGSAKREQGDVHDETIGELIAAARAFQSLSRQLMSEATKRVNASTKAQAAAKQRAQEKREAAKRPVKRRTREEWERLQKERRTRAKALGLDELAVGLGPVSTDLWEGLVVRPGD